MDLLSRLYGEGEREYLDLLEYDICTNIDAKIYKQL
jgi:hypothetical protein